MAWNTNATWGCCNKSTTPDPIRTSTIRSPDGNDTLALEASTNDGYVTVAADDQVYATFDGEFRGLVLGTASSSHRTLDVDGEARVRDKLLLRDQNVYLQSQSSGSMVMSATSNIDLSADADLIVSTGDDLL